MKSIKHFINFDSSLIKFGITGVAATAIHVIVVSPLILVAEFSAGIANGIAFVVATFFSSFVNTKWSFKKQFSVKVTLRFWSVAVLGCILAVLIADLIEELGFHYLVGVAAVSTLVPIISYLLHRYYTYR